MTSDGTRVSAAALNSDLKLSRAALGRTERRWRWRGAKSRALGFFAALSMAGLALPLAAAELRLERGSGGGGPEISVSADSGDVVAVESTADFTDWQETLRGHGPLRNLRDLQGPAGGVRFYRAWTRKRTAADDGKNVIDEPADGFLSPPTDPWLGQSRWIKFAILLDQPHRVWFQDSAKYPFHYEFGTARLPGFSGMTRSQFDAATLRLNGQRAVLGAVVFPPSTNIAEIGIQIVGLDPFPRESVAQWIEMVGARIQRRAGVQLLYLPTFEQSVVAREHASWFAARGITVSRAGRWVVGDECYATGWALGRLRFVPGGEIDEAYAAGLLTSDDVLMTDQVPAEVPPLAGIVSMLPATPNSHVALLSQSFGIPFVYVADAGLRERVRSWVDREIMVRAVGQFNGCQLTLEAVDGPIDPAVRSAILQLKEPPQLQLPPRQVAGRITLPAEDLRPRDIGIVGGKAANFGLLRQRVPTNSPRPALALTLDLWEAFLNQTLADGKRLRETIRTRLGGFVWPPDMKALQTELAAVRDLFTDAADFDAAQKAEILGALQAAGFDPTRRIRFRSSTNVEDGDQFSGAGLYDSFSGCLADELDGDTQGPSRCDPDEVRERGVFRAVKKVYASFYNDNAFLERRRHRVDEAGVGMGILVHPSSPDEEEAANGVATLRVSIDGGRFLGGNLVTQAGAVSVTNPDSTAVPENVSLFWSGGDIHLSVERHSSLVPLGSRVMVWESDYRKLANLMNLASRAYEAEFPTRKAFVLDFEFKKRLPDGALELKQMREVPQPPERHFTPWLVATSQRYEVYQGEHGDLIANHRLKSAWGFQVRTMPVRDAELASTPLRSLEGSWLDENRVVQFAGTPASLPGYRYSRTAEHWIDRWTQGEGDARRDMELQTLRIRETTSREGPLVIYPDHRLEWRVRYLTPRPSLGYIPEQNAFGPIQVREEAVALSPVTPVTAESLRQTRRIRQGGVTIVTSFWWPVPPKGPSAGYTAPVQAWIETRITGLTSGELVLRNEWSQTYRPGHHNFFEEFVFEPRLDPSVPAGLLEELAAKNVKAIVVGAPNDNFGDGYGFLWGLDETFRKF